MQLMATQGNLRNALRISLSIVLCLALHIALDGGHYGAYICLNYVFFADTPPPSLSDQNQGLA